MKLISLFSGIGAFEKALDRVGIDYELINFCELDKYAIRSYCAIHETPEEKNLGDITQIDHEKLPKDIDLITYGFPCQDISAAGNLKGFEHNGEKTRSGLFFDALKVIETTKPKVAIVENVKNLTGKKFKKEFEIVLNSLEEAGYNNYWKVLNAKNYGIPQNRERVFIVSIRKDIDNETFRFPEPFELKIRLKDILDSKVDEKYYLSDKCLNGFLKHNENHEAKGTGFKWKPRDLDGVASCLRANGALDPTDNTIIEPKVEQVGNIVNTGNWDNPQVGRVYSSEGLSPTLNTMQGGNRQPKVIVENVNKLEPVNTMPDGTCRTLKHQYYKTSTANFLRNSTFGATGVVDGFRIRKLTPKECWRLMGFDDEDFEKAEKVNSNTQLYKQAGNSIVVNVLEYLFINLYKSDAIKADEPQKEPRKKQHNVFQSLFSRIRKKDA